MSQLCFTLSLKYLYLCLNFELFFRIKPFIVSMKITDDMHTLFIWVKNYKLLSLTVHFCRNSYILMKFIKLDKLYMSREINKRKLW